MKKIIEKIEEAVKEAFAASEYDEKFAKVTVSNRPDLCEYQCNGAMAAAKTYKKAPIMIANSVVEKLQDNEMFESAEAVCVSHIYHYIDCISVPQTCVCANDFVYFLDGTWNY